MSVHENPYIHKMMKFHLLTFFLTDWRHIRRKNTIEKSLRILSPAGRPIFLW